MRSFEAANYNSKNFKIIKAMDRSSAIEDLLLLLLGVPVTVDIG